MNRILVAGGSGIVGSYLKQSFGTKNFKYISSKDCDLSSIDAVKKYFKITKKYDILIFLVGLAHRKGEINDFDEFLCANYNTLVNLTSFLNTEKKLPDKIIFASTISVYGEQKNKSQYDESSLLEPFSPYALTKLLAEQYLLDNHISASWILRFAPIYSSDFNLNINRRTKIANMFYKVGNGKKKLSLCNIENIKLTIAGIIHNNVPSGVYNISDSNDYSYLDLLQWQNARLILPIPTFMINLFYHIGLKSNYNLLRENSIKLLTDNIYPSDKIRAFIDLHSNLYNIEDSDA